MAKKTIPKKIKPVLTSNELTLLQRLIDNRVYDIHNKEWIVLMAYQANKEAFDKAREQIEMYSKLRLKLAELFESQFDINNI